MDLYKLPQDKTFLVSIKAAIMHEGKVLLLQSTANHRSWELPGGLIDIDENLSDGLRREVFEETTLEVNVSEGVLGLWDGWRKGFYFDDGSVRDVRVVEVIYQCDLISGNIELSEEHNESRWVTPEELGSLPMFSEQRKAIERQFQGHFGKERE